MMVRDWGKIKRMMVRGDWGKIERMMVRGNWGRSRG